MVKSTRITVFLSLIVAACLVGGLARANLAPPGKEYRLGLTLEQTADGPRIAALDKNGEAAKAGLAKGDLILAIDRRYAKVMSADDLKAVTDEPHIWPMDFIIVRNRDEVVVIRIES